MTAPPDRFRTHDRGPSRPRDVEQTRNSLCEIGGFHVIRVTPKRFIPPRNVVRVRLRATSPAQVFEVQIFDSRTSQGFRKILFVELRITTRAGETANVNQSLNIERLEPFYESFNRQSRMPNCPD